MNDQRTNNYILFLQEILQKTLKYLEKQKDTKETKELKKLILKAFEG